jgi:hypothetical protein
MRQVRWDGEKNREEFVMQVFKRWKDINIILFLSQDSYSKLDMSLTSELCQTIGDWLFFICHIFLEVCKTQDLPSKI